MEVAGFSAKEGRGVGRESLWLGWGRAGRCSLLRFWEAGHRGGRGAGE